MPMKAADFSKLPRGTSQMADLMLFGIHLTNLGEFGSWNHKEEYCVSKKVYFMACLEIRLGKVGLVKARLG